jgi:X-X-X-Leu-X-X-Gly heptad repeat protein
MKKIEKITGRRTFPMMTVQDGLTSLQTQIIELQSKVNELVELVNSLATKNKG